MINILMLSEVCFPKEFGCCLVGYEESLTFRGFFVFLVFLVFLFKEKCIGPVSGGTLSIVYGMNQSGGEIGGKNNTQMSRIVIDQQEGYSVSVFKDDEKEYVTGRMLLVARMKGNCREGYRDNSSHGAVLSLKVGLV